MVPRCERPACPQPAVVRWGFDPRRLLVWLDRPVEGGVIDHGLCAEHAERMHPPRGWWLDDRRVQQPALFPGYGSPAAVPVPAAGATEPADDGGLGSASHPDGDHDDDGAAATADTTQRGKGRRRKRREAARQRSASSTSTLTPTADDQPLPFTPDP